MLLVENPGNTSHFFIHLKNFIKGRLQCYLIIIPSMGSKKKFALYHL